MKNKSILNINRQLSHTITAAIQNNIITYNTANLSRLPPASILHDL